MRMLGYMRESAATDHRSSCYLPNDQVQLCRNLFVLMLSIIVFIGRPVSHTLTTTAESIRSPCNCSEILRHFWCSTVNMRLSMTQIKKFQLPISIRCCRIEMRSALETTVFVQ